MTIHKEGFKIIGVTFVALILVNFFSGTAHLLCHGCGYFYAAVACSCEFLP